MATTATDYAVDLEVFQGPLDLLLYLIRRDEIDVYDIPIARITGQYLKYVEMLRLLNLENAGEYILMAATLIRIKARMLLPRGLDEEDQLDPREELTRALLEYQKFRDAGEILREKRELEERLSCVCGRTNGFRPEGPVLAGSSSLYDLMHAFMEVVKNLREEESYLIDRPRINVEDRIEVIKGILADRQFAGFEEFFADVKIKLVAIVTLMAILELVKARRLTVRQSVIFSEIRIYRTDLLFEPLEIPPPAEETVAMAPAEVEM